MKKLATPAFQSIVGALLLGFVSACTPVIDFSPDPNPLPEILATADRSEADKARDEERKPAQVLHFFGVESGLTALDIVAAGGWYTEVLSAAVGAEGTVYAQNPKVMLELGDGRADKALTKRLTGNRLPNVIRLDRELDDLGLEPGSVDFALTALNFHDVYNENPRQARDFLQVIYTVLKPGGVLGLIDHQGAPNADNIKAHRMLKDDAVASAKSVGFRVSSSSVLENPDDDRIKNVFDPEIRGKTDRFVLKLTKPTESRKLFDLL